ncbi:hypothetical protein G7B40_041150 [Aetokthonos hydrillicola Thurmond2011]|jgi:hypothetical protein|uniref:Uncharacterized protein n=1 Tax=Aetokthonos hydrillicola Thurmond2011 TaxID=2712845 RepID=A0AAP5IFY8_9CYAN|nr:hypothetical protein [Aetokthonos hydrillicola]MBW4591126.1 hypothetical protein [Aetokthonos hydrillicola CCALA 1050]MDR9900895.1 hypothetical protein [Aetokthonos hydrillicola Thurmond2011]
MTATATNPTQFPEPISQAIEYALNHNDELCCGYVITALKDNSEISLGEKFNLLRGAIAQLSPIDKTAARILRKACRRVHRSSLV